MKQIYFFLTVLFFIQVCSFAQQKKTFPAKVFTNPEEILKAAIQPSVSENVNDFQRTIVNTLNLDGYVLESRTSQFWNEGVWVNSSKDLFTYNPAGLKIEEVNQIWINSQWMNSRRFLTTYFLNDLISLYEEQRWVGVQWGNAFKYVYSYNSNNLLSEYNVLAWNNAAFDSLYKTSYTYNGSGYPEVRLEQTWNGAGWNNNYRYSFQYNNNNDVTERLEEEWVNNGWKNSIRDIFTYNSQNQLELMASFWWPDTAWKESVEIYYEYDSYGNINDMLTKFWESETLGLQNKYHTAYEFLPDTNLETKAENQEWNLQLSVWINTSRNITSYNPENKIDTFLSEVWSGGTWAPGFQERYTYDENGNIDTLLAQYWDGAQWVNTFRAYHSWGFVVSVDDGGSIPNEYLLEQNYPNPFNSGTRIMFSLAMDAEVSLTLYDILGNEITKLINGRFTPGKHEIHFNASQLTSGVYFYRLNAYGSDGSNSFSSVRKMLLLK